MTTLAVRVLWTPDVKLLEARLERRTDRTLPYPRRVARAARRAIERAKVILLPDLSERQGELFRR